MKIEPGQTVLLTGASGGLGTVMTRAFAECGFRQALVAFPGIELEDLASAVRDRGTEVLTFASDLQDPEQRRHVVREVQHRFGKIDILVNNAGVEYNSFYHELSEARINEVLNVNLTAAMILSRLVLPGMLERKQGHIISISSLAGKSGPAFQEPYAASKAALVAFTMSLRATYRELGVSASVVVPGFVEAGIYSRLKQTAGRPAPRLLGACSPERVAQAVLRALRRDVSEIIVNRYPIRPVLMLTALSPSLGAWLSSKFGTNEFFRAAVLAQKRESGS
ncbi:MAG TPA: SDR family NAD(P)-dependent oxidoreductase [Verrucomicrobiae bacterium]